MATTWGGQGRELERAWVSQMGSRHVTLDCLPLNKTFCTWASVIGGSNYMQPALILTDTVGSTLINSGHQTGGVYHAALMPPSFGIWWTSPFSQTFKKNWSGTLLYSRSSRTYSSCITKILYALNSDSSFPSPLSSQQTPFYSLLRVYFRSLM